MFGTTKSSIWALPLLVIIVLSGCSDSDRAPTDIGDGDGNGNNTGDEHFAVGGQVTGLEQGGLTLENADANETLAIDNDGDFAFSEPLENGDTYSISVLEQPPRQFCRISRGTGVIDGADASDVLVECFSAPSLVAQPDIMQVRLFWDGPDTVDILYSSDPDCDWDNHSLCENSGLVTAANGGRLDLGAVEEGLDPDIGWFFVADFFGLRSQMVAARPAPPSVFDDVNAMLTIGDRLYLGGEFTAIAPNTGSGSAFSLDSGELAGILPLVDDTINAVVPDGQGGWYIGGSFETVAGEPRSSLARIDRHGVLDPNWEPALEGTVMTLAVADNTVYAGGLIQEAGSEARRNLAAFDAESGTALDWAPEVDSRVDALAIRGNHIYAGGFFTEAVTAAGTAKRERLAAFDRVSGELLDWHPGTDARVNALLVHENVIYVGGDFTNIGGVARIRLAAVDADTSAIQPWDPAADDQVHALAMGEDRIYAGGEFTLTGGGTVMSTEAMSADPQQRTHLAAYDTEIGEVLGWNPGALDGPVHAIVVHDDRVHIGGSFTRAAGESRARLAAFHTHDGSLTDWAPRAAFTVESFAIAGDRVYVGAAAGGKPRHSLAAMDAHTGILLDWQAQTRRTVNALAHLDGVLYAGGSFSQANDDRRTNLAAFDTDTGELLDWSPEVRCCVYSLMAMEGTAEVSARVYAGGTFSTAEDAGETVDRPSLAAFDATSGHLLDWNPGTDGGVFTLDAFKGDIIIGGNFSEVDGAVRDNLAAVDAVSGIHSDWDPGVNGEVSTVVALPTGYVYAGGFFTQAGGGSTDDSGRKDRNRLASFGAETGGLTSWDPALQGFHVSDILVRGTLDDGVVYIGGDFNQVGADPREYVAAVDPLHPAAAFDWHPVVDGSFPTAIAANNDSVYVAGLISGVNDRSRVGLAALDRQSGELIW